jgi:hypothetical protein
MEVEQIMACLLAEIRNASKARNHDTEPRKNERQTKGDKAPPKTPERKNAGQNGSQSRKYDGQDGNVNPKALLLTIVVKKPLLNGPLGTTP